MNRILRLMVLCAPLMLASCGAKRVLIKDQPVATTQPKADATDAARRQLAFVQKVNDRKVYAKNIVADMTFTIQTGDRKITVPGSLHMRRGEVIRLQLFVPLLGSEVGRLEFTPDYVLVVDRLHKQYVKGDYNQLDFLRTNGLNFYSLQALFWNELLLPGTEKVGEGDLKQFAARLDGTGQTVPVTLRSGNIDFTWQADRQSGAIAQADVAYSSDRHGKSELKWKYDGFKPLGSKQYPAQQELAMTTSATGKTRSVSVRMVLDDLNMSDDWETRSTVSDRYKQIQAADILGKLLNM